MYSAAQGEWGLFCPSCPPLCADEEFLYLLMARASGGHIVDEWAERDNAIALVPCPVAGCKELFSTEDECEQHCLHEHGTTIMDQCLINDSVNNDRSSVAAGTGANWSPLSGAEGGAEGVRTPRGAATSEALIDVGTAAVQGLRRGRSRDRIS